MSLTHPEQNKCCAVQPAADPAMSLSHPEQNKCSAVQPAAAMRLLLTPSGLCEAFIKRLRKQLLWTRISQVPFHKVLISNPFTGHDEWASPFLKDMLGPDVECVKCSLFHADALDLLESADAFYMGGANEPEACMLFRHHVAGRMLERLAELIRDGTIFYIGCCGGSMYPGRYFSVDRNFQCMDLFGGLSIGVSDKANENALRPHVNLEPKFAALVYVAPEEVCAAGFVCTKSGVCVHHDSAVKLQADLQSHLERVFLSGDAALSPVEQSKSSAAQPACDDYTPLYRSFLRSLEGARNKRLASAVIRFVSDECFFGDLLHVDATTGWYSEDPHTVASKMERLLETILQRRRSYVQQFA